MRKHLRLFIPSSFRKEVGQIFCLIEFNLMFSFKEMFQMEKAWGTFQNTTFYSIASSSHIAYCYRNAVNVVVGFGCFHMNPSLILCSSFASLRCNHVRAFLVQCIRHGQKRLHSFWGKVLFGDESFEVQTLQTSSSVKLWTDKGHGSCSKTSADTNVA